MTSDQIKNAFDEFIEWPSDNHTTISANSALIFARVIAHMAVAEEREECALICEFAEARSIGGELAAQIRARGER